MFSARVQEEDFSAASELKNLQAVSLDIGAVASFIGCVRQSVEEKSLKAMTLEHYPGMAEKQLTDILGQARQRWPIDAGVIIHRSGRLYPGDQIVFVGTASRHRDAAFQSAQFLMDWLKTKAPFWKKEEFEDEKTQWVQARDADLEKTDQWS